MSMPLVKVEIVKGKSPEYKKMLLEGIHSALEKSLGIESWDRFQRLYELDPECFEMSDSKSDKFTMIEICMFPGRSREQKKLMFEEIVKELGVRPGIDRNDIFIVINEPDNENWGLAGIQRE